MGIDCVGLLACAGAEAGVTIQDVTNYPRALAGSWLVDQLTLHCERLIKSGPYELGDVLVFAFAEELWHVAIVTQVEPLRIVHAYVNALQCVESPVPQAWERRLHSAWRVR